MDAALYCVATPIGNLGDITHRAIEVLRESEVIYAEDTRVTRKLLSHLGIRNELLSLHDHNEVQRVDEILLRIKAGQSVALVSDAGTPLISDPGYVLVSQLSAKGIRIIPVPGASAVITALSAAGLPTDRFVFEGFLSAKPGVRRKQLGGLAKESRTMVLYESGQRLVALLTEMLEQFGSSREIVIARELTKLYEQFYRGTIADLLSRIGCDNNMLKGEFVLVIQGVSSVSEEEMNVLAAEQVLKTLLDELPVKQAAGLAAKLTGLPKNQLYRQALEISH